jgi:hypothetical protein
MVCEYRTKNLFPITAEERVFKTNFDGIEGEFEYMPSEPGGVCSIQIIGTDIEKIKKLREMIIAKAKIMKTVVLCPPFSLTLPNAWARLVWLIKWIIKG